MRGRPWMAPGRPRFTTDRSQWQPSCTSQRRKNREGIAVAGDREGQCSRGACAGDMAQAPGDHPGLSGPLYSKSSSKQGIGQREGESRRIVQWLARTSAPRSVVRGMARCGAAMETCRIGRDISAVTRRGHQRNESLAPKNLESWFVRHWL